MNLNIKTICCAFLVLNSAHAFAGDQISVSVKTKAKNVFAIGFNVDGRDFGGLGDSFTAKGPIHKTYFFGYRKDSVFGININCGSLTLNQDSTVILVTKDNQCTSVLG